MGINFSFSMQKSSDTDTYTDNIPYAISVENQNTVKNQKFTDCKIKSNDTIIVTYINCLFTDCAINNHIFIDCKLYDCKLKKCTLTNCAIKDCTLKDCKFS